MRYQENNFGMKWKANENISHVIQNEIGLSVLLSLGPRKEEVLSPVPSPNHCPCLQKRTN
jgi:hypothetical protein